MSVAIEFRNVSKRFRTTAGHAQSLQESAIRLMRGQWRRERNKGFWAVQDVSFQVPARKSIGIIGANGSGKSTILKLMTGILLPTTGQITVNGRVLALLELGTGMHPELTGRENIYLNGSLLGFTTHDMRARFDKIVAFSEIGGFLDMPVKHYSSGMYVRLAFSVAVYLDPQILVVDEVLAVGDAAFQQKCLDRIATLRRQGVTILMVSHDTSTMQSFCDELIWMEDGKVRSIGKPTDVMMEYMQATADHVSETVYANAQLPDRRDDESPIPSPGSQPQGRWGSGRIEITRVEITDGAGTSRQAFNSGKPLQVHLHYRADEPIEDPVFGIGITHINGTHISGPNSGVAGIRIPRVEGEGIVTYEIPALPLLQGSYLLSVACHRRDDSELFDYHDRLYSFSVYPGRGGEHLGLMALGGRWYADQPVPA